MYTDEYYTYESIRRIQGLIQRASNVQTDPEPELRTLERLCRWCFYGRGSIIAGQAFTYYKCELCGTEDHWSNTAVPKVCHPCSVNKNVCIRCRGDINLHA